MRSVAMAPAVAEALARLSQREHWTGDDDHVFPRLMAERASRPAI